MVDRAHSFDELREAYAYVDGGRKIGNLVVTTQAGRNTWLS